jgi:polyphosphate kinase
MPRNLYNRVEIVFPIENAEHRRYITEELLGRQIADNSGAWKLMPNGEYSKIARARDEDIRDSQAEFLGFARALEKTTRRRKPAPQISRPTKSSTLTKRRKKG